VKARIAATFEDFISERFMVLLEVFLGSCLKIIALIMGEC
jgi:hypothetical protein